MLFRSNIFVSQKVFDEVNDICQKNNINLITNLLFQRSINWYDNIDFSSHIGYCFIGLAEVANKEVAHGDDHLLLQLVTGTGELRQCHMSAENNKIFANLMLKSLNDNQKKVVDLEKFPFVYKKEISNRYIL